MHAAWANKGPHVIYQHHSVVGKLLLGLYILADMKAANANRSGTCAALGQTALFTGT